MRAASEGRQHAAASATGAESAIQVSESESQSAREPNHGCWLVSSLNAHLLSLLLLRDGHIEYDWRIEAARVVAHIAAARVDVRCHTIARAAVSLMYVTADVIQRTNALKKQTTGSEREEETMRGMLAACANRCSLQQFSLDFV